MGSYLGQSPETDIQVNKYKYVVGTATSTYNGSTTIFPCTYDRVVDVYVDGGRIEGDNFISDTGTSITFSTPLSVGMVVMIDAYYNITNVDATVMTYDNTASGLTADTIQDAVDEIVANPQGAVGGGNDAVFYENDTNITTSYTITSGKNAVTAGRITIDTGVRVSIPTGSRWTVV